MGTLVNQNFTASTLVSYSVALTGVTGMNCLIVTLCIRNGATGSTVSGSVNGAFTRAVFNNSSHAAEIWYRQGVTGGDETVTITLSGAEPSEAVLSEWSGLATSSVLDQTAANQNEASPTSHPNISVTPTGAGIVIGAFMHANSITPTITGGGTEFANTVDPIRYLHQYKTGVASTAEDLDYTTVAVNGYYAMASFLDAASGGSAPKALMMMGVG